MLLCLAPLFQHMRSFDRDAATTVVEPWLMIFCKGIHDATILLPLMLGLVLDLRPGCSLDADVFNRH